MRRIRGYHLLFGLSLALLGALGAWWLVFFLQSVELEKDAQLNKLVHVTVVSSLILGHGVQRPALGPLPRHADLEVIRSADSQSGDLFSPLIPHFPELGVRPLPVLVNKVHERVQRRRLMFIGEGSLLLILLGIVTFMLYRLVRTDRRNMQRMEAFLSTVTHEMKTPLTGIKSMLQTFAAGKVPKDQGDMLYAMGLKEAERLEHMVENVLISGHLRTERYKVYNQPVGLRSMIEGFVEHRRRYLVERPEAIGMVWEPSEADVVVVCDPNALHIVLENLTDNAFKYGGEEPKVEIQVRRTDGHVELSVKDRGIGFDPKKARDLFIPFRRSLEAKEAVQHGTGLGLSIAREIALRMGGDLRAESEGPGAGSRFTITLEEADA